MLLYTGAVASTLLLRCRCWPNNFTHNSVFISEPGKKYSLMKPTVEQNPLKLAVFWQCIGRYRNCIALSRSPY